jgi:asparagine synthase (glutamine-hydrolysing)
MCGIWSYIEIKSNDLDTLAKRGLDSASRDDVSTLFQDFMNLKHRGPDSSHFDIYNNVIVGFHRLAIVNNSFSGNQPFILSDENRTIIFVANGEIYNYKEIIEKYGLSSDVKSDCFVIPEVYMNMLKENAIYDFNRFIRDDIKGEYSFILYEFDRLKNLKKVIVGRDELGVRPLYHCPYEQGNDVLFFTSEVKGGLSFTEKLEEFPPGHIYTYTFDELENVTCDKYNYSTIYSIIPIELPDEKYLKNIQKAVLNSVRRRLDAEKSFAFLLSGGVDSSLVAALSAKILGKPIRTFCCSIKGDDGKGVGTDLAYSKMVAEHIGSNHTEVLFTPEEGLAAIPDVIRTICSHDITSIRASVGQYLVCKYIGQNTDSKVLLCGEGPDEVCSSYLFNWYAPDGDALDKCAKEYVKNIHYYDMKRADRCIARWGLEGRVPLLDPEFIKAYWTIPGEKRMPTYKGLEKWWLRAAFKDTGILPDEVLWRQKSAFSDAISSKEKSWFSIIQEFVEDKVSDKEMIEAAKKYPYCTPQTKEAYYYRKIFCEIFGEDRQNIIPHFWQPKWDSNGNMINEYIDPSARILNVCTN